MLEYLPELCRELNGNIREIYWVLLAPFTLLLIILELFQTSDQNPDVIGLLKRVVISIIMLTSFNECVNLIAFVGDSLVEKIHGTASLSRLVEHLELAYQEAEFSWLKLRESVVFVICILSYIVAYAGVFIANILVHFTWSILYICSPLMILMYVSKKTAFVTSSLYKGLINVICWKVIWSILAVMLLKFATNPDVGDVESLLTTILVNLCIGLSMLFVPLTTRSLSSDGASSLATTLAVAPAYAISRALKGALAQRSKGALLGSMGQAKHGVNKLISPLQNSLRRAQSSFQQGPQSGREGRQSTSTRKFRRLQGFRHQGEEKPIKSNVLYPDFRKGEGDKGPEKE